MTDEGDRTVAAAKRRGVEVEGAQLDQLSTALRHVVLEFATFYEDARTRRVNRVASIVSKSRTDAARDAKRNEAGKLMPIFVAFLDISPLTDLRAYATVQNLSSEGSASELRSRLIQHFLERVQKATPALRDWLRGVMGSKALTVSTEASKAVIAEYLRGQGEKVSPKDSVDDLRETLDDLLHDSMDTQLSFLRVALPALTAGEERKAAGKAAGKAKAAQTLALKKKAQEKRQEMIAKVLLAARVGATFRIESKKDSVLMRIYEIAGVKNLSPVIHVQQWGAGIPEYPSYNQWLAGGVRTATTRTWRMHPEMGDDPVWSFSYEKGADGNDFLVSSSQLIRLLGGAGSGSGAGSAAS